MNSPLFAWGIQYNAKIMANNKKKSKANNSKAKKNANAGKATPFRDAGKYAGTTLAGMFNPALAGLGGVLGSYIGSGVGKIFGSGSYAMTNTCWNVAQQVPAMHSDNETVIFRHREFIGDIYGTSAFTGVEYPINPGIAGTFPYLSTIAQNFQQYRFRGLVFEFRSTSATALVSGTNTAMGTVMLAAQYKSDAPNFYDKQAMLNEMWSVDCKPSENVFLPVECSSVETPMKYSYVRTGALSPNQDIKLYDLATLTVATQGSQASNIVGELWATYDVELKKPTLSGSLELAGESYVTDYGGVLGTVPLGQTVNSSFDTIGIARSGGRNITFPASANGNYYVSFFWFGTAAACSPPSVTLTNCSYISVSSNNTQLGFSGASATDCSISFLIKKADPTVTASIDLSTGGTYPGSGRVVVQIHQVNGGITPT